MIDPYGEKPIADVPAEMAVLNAMVLDASSCAGVLDMMEPQMFYLPDHVAIAEAIVAVRRAGEDVNAASVRGRLKAAGQWEAIGGPEYFSKVMNAIVHPSHWPHYADSVVRCWRRNWLMKFGFAAMEAAKQNTCDPIRQCVALRDRLNSIIRNSTEAGARDGGMHDLSKLLSDIEAGFVRAIPWMFPQLSGLTKSLRPATQTVLCGTAGFGKSLLVNQLLIHLYRIGVSAACFMLEGGRAFHLSRTLAILAGDSRLLDDDYIRTNPGLAARVAGEFGETIEGVGRTIFEARDLKRCDLPNLAGWVERQAECNRVLIIDPISLAEAGRDRYVTDERFQRIARDAVEKYGVSLILITHPKARPGNRGPLTLDDIAGGAVYQRAAETVLLLEKHQEPKPFRVMTADRGDNYVRARRSIRILKARNGPGSGQQLALDFLPARLQLAELGLVVGDGAEAEADR